MICVHCGKEIDNGQDFCPYCGGRVGSDAATETKAAKKAAASAGAVFWAASAVSAAGAVVFSDTAGAAVPHPASIAAAIRQDRGITFFFIMIFSFVFVLLTPPL